MGKYLINGRKKISGTLKLSGSKNSALPILAAVVLNPNESVIHNCPDILDTRVAMEILRYIGCKVLFEENTVVVKADCIDKFELPSYLVKRMRSSIIFMGAILSRMGKVKINYPGGCSLGRRPIDFHISSLKKMGAKVYDDGENIFCEADRLNGCQINLDFPSVGATQNIILSSVLANGQTKIINAAREPEIVDLQNFLKGMGADINGAGTSEIIINGVEQKDLKPVEHTVIPDRIVAGTYLLSAAITNGKIELENVEPNHLPMESFLRLGCEIKKFPSKIFLDASGGRINSIKKITTAPYPGFPTDLQAQFVSVLSVANGQSFVEEKIFESRYRHIPELIKMGAEIKIMEDNCFFVIDGIKNLHGTDLFSKDLRGGAALILAALSAEGQSIVHDENFIKRGYENFETNLCALCADVKFVL